MIIDIHGHYTTAPAALNAYRGRQMALQNKPVKGSLSVTDEQIAASLAGHLDQMTSRGIDSLFFSPRASAMGHDVGDEVISRHWTEINNDLIARVAGLYPGRFVPVCQLPQSPGVPAERAVQELRRCVEELGFVGCLINPDVSGGLAPFTPSLGDRSWYPLWEAMVELDVPGMIHASSTRNPALHLNGSHYIAQHYAAVVELCSSNVFEDFPTLRLIVPHGGGGIPFHFNRNRALHVAESLPPFEEVVRNLYFDTAVYDADSLEMLIRKIGVDNVLFGSEMFGTAKTRDAESGRFFDDILGDVEALGLSTEDRAKVLTGNALKVFPRAAKHLSLVGVQS
ncbi:4-oxalmesaconate hydratase [Kribbella orskensis]|uniref:4-oxalmesaconate hydratase n=1 Tax=Kribbella orskensis TaxID=2512216 RepID=A0ABY2B9W0_9ACTN|nr:MULTISPECIES: amidohydrolase family protein [Kribbella]TCN32271.1 4-oxalmesaconate hydratase [Kribbella sp. VKM Ac-2500]TCO12634.1 4-oxalmesaconate hydratase [Kribbella orskensis]